MPALDPSDVVLLVDFVLAIVVMLYFALGKPRTWFRDRLGWVLFSYSVVTVGLLFLIVWGIVFGQRVDEWVRFLLSALFGVGLVAKGWAMYRERHAGRIAGAGAPTGRKTMSTPSNEALKNVTEIWYKGKRVLRTIVAVGVPAFLGLAALLPQIITALGLPVDSQLQLWLVGLAAGVTAVAAAITRIMAIPAVNAWLIKIGLGSVPKDAVVTSPVNGTTIVKADPKAKG